MKTSSTLRFLVFIFSFLFFSTANSFATHAAKDHSLIQLVIAPQKVKQKKKTWKEKLGIAFLEKRIQKKIKKLQAKEKKKASTSSEKKHKKQRINILAILSTSFLPIGILLSIFLSPMPTSSILAILLIAGLVAIFTGVISMAIIRENPEKYTGKLWAIAGIYLGAITCLALAVYISVASSLVL